MNSRLLALAVCLVVSVVTGTALAGDCPVCTSAADCPARTDGGPQGFCVLWTTSPGCGTTLQICCPGQGCGLAANGRPTCEADSRCVVVEGASDAGTTDASTPTDAGSASGDAGASVDSGTATDAATADAGPGTMRGGCGCSVPARAPSGLRTLAMLSAAIGFVFVSRRRRS